MAACEVSQIVASIVAAYNSGFDVFRRMKCKKRSKSSSKDPKIGQEEAQLQTSLQHRPRDIRSEYERNVASHGHRFEIGDTIAHTSLAHTLLVLNSGLINVLNNSLSDDVLRRRQSQRSLLSISEVAAADALYALSQLSNRLVASQSRIPRLFPMQIEAPKAKKQSHPRRPTKTTLDIKFDPKVQSRAEKHFLARGGWVRRPASRSRSGSSVVTAASSRNASTVKLADHKRSQSETASPAPSNQSPKASPRPRPRHRRMESTPMISTSPPQYMVELPDDPNTQQRYRAPDQPKLSREPSMLVMPSDFFESQIELAPPRPPKIPLHTRPIVTPRPSMGTRPRPPSVATFMTTSTKIGEIPEHKWPDRPILANGELRPMPYVIPPPLDAEDMSPKKKGRGFRFWRKAEQTPQAVVY